MKFGKRDGDRCFSGLFRGTVAMLVIIAGILAGYGQENKARILLLKGEVVESMGHTPLMGTKVSLLDSAYNEIDTVRTKSNGIVWKTGGMAAGSKTAAEFTLKLPREKGRYYIIFEKENYMPFTKTLDITHIGGREEEREIGLIQLVREPRQLGEVTVTATKIKFYNRGDTLVFNADAFELPEGSMLDALVAQLPGVEIRENGQIYVNGRFVNNLILNGKDFFKEDKSVMLQNLGSYMVKNVAVYEKQTELNEFTGMELEKKDFVMDVRLKKEYMQGWIANIEGGTGTDSRYMGRIFGMRYTDFSRIALFGNVNNLNDNGRQGQSGGFDPAQTQTGSRRHQSAGLEINANSRDEKLKGVITVNWAHTLNFTDEKVTRQNFLPEKDTYAYRFGNRKLNSSMLRAYAYGSYTTAKTMNSVALLSDYSRYDNRSGDIEATFNEEQQEVTRALLDSMYAPGSLIDLGRAVNRIASRNLAKGHDYKASASLYETVKIPYTTDALSITLKGTYGENRQQGMTGYLINTGNSPFPTNNQGLWSDSKPNRNYELNGELEYSAKFGKNFGSIYYHYSHSRRVRNRLTLTLENLSDLGVYGLVAPEEAEYSEEDSYWSTTSGNLHEAGIKFSAFPGKISLRIEGGVEIKGEDLWYNRFGNAYKKRRGAVMPVINQLTLGYGWGQRGSSRNFIRAGYAMKGLTPNLEWLLPITDDTDPMNIYEGAESLKNQLNHQARIAWEWTAGRRPLRHTLTLDYNLQSNALVRGYTYDTRTGVRHIRSYNTSGNWTEGASSNLSLQFGPKRKMTLSNNVGVSYGHATDMIGTDVERPARSTIRNLYLTEGLNLTWQVGRQNLGLKANAVWRHTTGDREGFKEINSATINYGLTGVFKLPLGFGLSTDLTMYMREGYNMPGLDKTDLVWNARLSRPLDNGRWVLMVDGFDLLHQLSNVTYAENAQGRTVTYINSLPRYVLFHAIYRIDIKPRKR